jgi:hypothetical protein
LDKQSFAVFAQYQTTQLYIVAGVVLLLLVAAIVFIAVGLPVVGLVLLVAEITALVGAFFWQRRDRGSSSANDPE